MLLSPFFSQCMVQLSVIFTLLQGIPVPFSYHTVIFTLLQGITVPFLHHTVIFTLLQGITVPSSHHTVIFTLLQGITVPFLHHTVIFTLLQGITVPFSHPTVISRKKLKMISLRVNTMVHVQESLVITYVTVPQDTQVGFRTCLFGARVASPVVTYRM